MTRAGEARPADPRLRGARAELRSWYLERLRPKLARAVTAGVVEPAAVEQIDIEVAHLLEPPGHLGEAA